MRTADAVIIGGGLSVRANACHSLFLQSTRVTYAPTHRRHETCGRSNGLCRYRKMPVSSPLKGAVLMRLAGIYRQFYLHIAASVVLGCAMLFSVTGYSQVRPRTKTQSASADDLEKNSALIQEFGQLFLKMQKEVPSPLFDLKAVC